MIFKRKHFPIFSLLLIIFLFLQSCKKQENAPLSPKRNTQYYKFLTLAEKQLANSKYDSAFYYYNKSKLACASENRNDKIIYSLLQMAIIQQNQADYSSSETTATEAISYFQKGTNIQYKIGLYNLLGINFQKLFDYDTSIHYFNQAYNLTKDELSKAIIKNNISVVFINKENYHKAIMILLPLLSKKEVLNNTENHARILDNLGYCYLKLENKKAFEYLIQSLVLKKQTENCFGITTSYLHLSEFYATTKPNITLNYAQLAYEKATKTNNTDDRLLALSLLIKNSSANQSKEYSKKYLSINDSILKVRQKAKNQFAKIKYDSKVEKEENLKLKAQKAVNDLQLAEQKNHNHLLLFIFIIGLGVTTTFYFFFKIKNQKEKIKTSYDTEVRIAKKLHDELANDVFQTMAFAETQDLTSIQNKETLITNLDAIYTRTRNISRENSTIETGKNFVLNLKEMMAGFNTPEINILINGLDDFNWTLIASNKKITIYRVLQELFVNMKKHSQCSLVVIYFKKDEKYLRINYSDNGLGTTLEEINFKNGLQNVENRILAQKGTITFDTKSDKGFKTSFTIPI